MPKLAPCLRRTLASVLCAFLSVGSAPWALALGGSAARVVRLQVASQTPVPPRLGAPLRPSAGAPAPVLKAGSGVVSLAPSAPAAAAAAQAAAAVSPAVSAAAPLAAAEPGRGARVRASLLRLFGRPRAGRAFDGARMGFLPLPLPVESDGVRLDPKPVLPSDTGVSTLSWDALSEEEAGGALSRQELPGAPSSAADVDKALRELIAADPRRYGGVRVKDLGTALAKRVESRAGLETMVYVSYRQKVNEIAVDGGYLDFAVKLADGKAWVASSSARLFSLEIDTREKLSSEEQQNKAVERLGLPPSSVDEMKELGSKVMYLGGRWRTVSLFLSPRRTALVAVDVASGETFAWDPRLGLGGKVSGRGVEFDPAKTADKLDEMPLAHIEIVTEQGRTFHSDANGEFVMEGTGDAEVAFTVRLRGKYVEVRDQGRKDLVLKARAKPGERIQAVFNPHGAEENPVAQVNTYRHVNRVHDYMGEQGFDVSELDRPIPANPNMDDECNAYYTPGEPTLNFFSSSRNCINTAYDTVIYHEYGHFVDDMFGGIVNGGLSEGWGDILGMYITGQPVLGEGFLKGQKRDYIRHGENTYQYDPGDEVHAQGEAWMGFAWKLRKALIASFGAAQGVAAANALVIPVLLAKARDIPQAISAVLVRDMDKDGKAPHLKQIQEAAAAHGIKVSLPKGGAPSVGPLSLGEMSHPASANPAEPALQQGVIRFSTSRWKRASTRAIVDEGARRFGLKYALKETPYWLRCKYELTLSGAQENLKSFHSWLKKRLRA